MKRLVELYVGFPDRTWSTLVYFVPTKLPREAAVALAKSRLLEWLEQEGYEVAFIGLYSYEEDPAEA